MYYITQNYLFFRVEQFRYIFGKAKEIILISRNIIYNLEAKYKVKN